MFFTTEPLKKFVSHPIYFYSAIFILIFRPSIKGEQIVLHMVPNFTINVDLRHLLTQVCCRKSFWSWWCASEGGEVAIANQQRYKGLRFSNGL